MTDCYGLKSSRINPFGQPESIFYIVEMRPILYLFVLLVLSCQDKKQQNQTEVNQNEESRTQEGDQMREKPLAKSYSNREFGFSFNYPKDYQVYEGSLPGEVPVINVFEAGTAQPPLAIHEDAGLNYISVLPEGFGVDGPGGERKNLQEWDGEVPVSFDVDPEKSTVYLLENGEPWAFYLRPQNPPESWSKYGGIFVHYAVQEFKTKCIDKETGREIAAKECDPMTGDVLKFYGEIASEAKESLNQTLQSLKLQQPSAEAPSASIRVENPQPGSAISSPLKITGRARGSWFFEAVAPVKLVTEDGEILGKSHIEAKENWMTTDFVPFEGSLSFELSKNEPPKNTAKEKRGYLLINRANASGKEEHAESLRIPVIIQ